MKTSTRTIVIITILMLAMLPSLGAGAQEGVDFGDQVGYHQQTGKVSFIGTAAGEAIELPQSLAPGMLAQDQGMAILSVYAPLFGEDAPAKNLVQTSFMQQRGQATTRYQQTYQGIPVFAGELVMNTTDSGQLISLAGELSPGLDLSIKPGISAGAAAQTALQAIAKYYGGEAAEYTASDPELWIYDPRLVEPSSRLQSLVWRTEVTGDGDLPVRALVLIDAQHGFISLQFNQIDTFWSSEMRSAGGGTEVLIEPESASQFAGVVPRETYTMNNSANDLLLPGTLLCGSADPNCSGAGGDLDAVRAHQYAGDTYAFYYDFHGRDSIDDAGMTVVSSVHYDTSYCNAFWNGDQMVYGDGCPIARADDVVGHELTHGVTQYTSNLMYYSQSGAINESFSDVWGEFVDLTNGAGSDDPGDRWMVGEDIAGYGPIRSMSNPASFGDPDRMSSYDHTTGDELGVHSNSGINNKAVYLMVDGELFNGYAIDGIGIEKVAAIYYRAQTTMLTSGANYMSLYYAVNQACQDLINGPEGISVLDCSEVGNALLAVEMDQPVPGNAPEAGWCPSGTTPSNIFYDSFESGVGLWTTNSVSGTPWVWGGGYATSGLYDYWGEDVGVEGELYTQMTSAVSLPVTLDALYLRFNHSYDFDWWSGGEYYDGGILEYSVNSGAWADAGALFAGGQDYVGTITDWGDLYPNPRLGEWAFGGLSHGYVSSRYIVSAYNGSAINFRWTVATDSFLGAYGWDIDDVVIYQCITQPVPGSPANLQATDGEILDEVNISWDSEPMADWYNVYRHTADVFGSASLLEGSVTRTIVADYGTINYDPYFYWVEACNVNGCSAPAGSETGYSAGLQFWDDFETTDLSRWTRFNDGSGFLYACPAAGINGTYGACVERGTNDKRKQLIDDSPLNEITYNARFNFDINNLSMATGERFRFLQFKMDAERPAFIVLKYDSGVYSIQLNTLLDDRTKVKTGWYDLPNAPTTIEVEWQQSSAESANDGFARLYLDGVQQEGLTGLDNFQISITSFRMGFTSKLAGRSISGIFYLDDVGTSNAGYIGLP